MENKSKFEVIILGGGLAGLTAATHLASEGIRVLLLETHSFPRHKVCGEYLSLEIVPYLESLSVALQDYQPKQIRHFHFSTRTGKSLEGDLPLGGLGISRYALDYLLYQTALRKGAVINFEKVLEVEFSSNCFSVHTDQQQYSASYVLGAFGKRSNLDKKLQRKSFINPSPWVAVKEHFSLDSFREDEVGLHNFKGGYCGLSMTETGAVNACYLAAYKHFKQFKDPEKFQKEVLCQNPYLRRFFRQAESLFDKPLAIAQISFGRKPLVENHMLMVGDSAGLIYPLSGNGMAMAIHSAKIASELVAEEIRTGQTCRQRLENLYIRKWEDHFWFRMKTGSLLQRMMMMDPVAEFSQQVLARIPHLLPKIIRSTHGEKIRLQ